MNVWPGGNTGGRARKQVRLKAREHEKERKGKGYPRSEDGKRNGVVEGGGP